MSQLTVFARRLKEARNKVGMKQADLAKKAKITTASISAYESADGTKGKNPSLENAKSIAEALNVSLDWLCGLNIKNSPAVEPEATASVSVNSFLKILVPLIECGLCHIGEKSKEDMDYNPELNKIVPITYTSTVIEFENYTLQNLFTGVGKLIELKNNGLLPEETYKISVDGIIERSKMVFIDTENGRVSDVTEFAFSPAEDIFKL